MRQAGLWLPAHVTVACMALLLWSYTHASMNIGITACSLGVRFRPVTGCHLKRQRAIDVTGVDLRCAPSAVVGSWQYSFAFSTLV